MTPSPGPDAMCIGQARLTAGLDRLQRIDLNTHYSVFGNLPRLTSDQLITATARRPPPPQLSGPTGRVRWGGGGGAGFPLRKKRRGVVQPPRQRKKRVV